MVVSAIILSPVFIQCGGKEPPAAISEVAVTEQLNDLDSPAPQYSEFDFNKMKNVSEDHNDYLKKICENDVSDYLKRNKLYDYFENKLIIRLLFFHK